MVAYILNVEVGLVLADGPVDGLHGLANGFFSFLFWPCIIGLYFNIFLFLHISKTSP
jgi:hypothetical protein